MSATLNTVRAFVIGAGSATGRAIAVALAEAGAHVSVATITPERSEAFAVNSVANEIWAIQRKGVARTLDADDSDQVADAIRGVAREMGGVTTLVVVSSRIEIAQSVRAAATMTRDNGVADLIVVADAAAAPNLVSMLSPDTRDEELVRVHGIGLGLPDIPAATTARNAGEAVVSLAFDLHSAGSEAVIYVGGEGLDP